MKIESRLALRYLFRGKAKHLSFIGIIACAGIALGVGTLIIVISVMNGFDHDLTSRLLKFNYHLTIEAESQEKLEEVKARLSNFPEVENCALYAQTQVFAKFDSYLVPIVARGLDFSDSKEKEFFYKYVTKYFPSEGFFLGEGLRERFNIGQKIEYYPLKKSLKAEEEQVKGFFKIGIYDIDNNYIIADFNKIKSLSPNYLIYLGVRLRNPYESADVKRHLREIFPESVYVFTWMESNKVLFSALQLEKLVMFIILSLIVLVATFNIFATITVKVVEKTKDIGILKSLGFTNRAILMIFSLQGLLLGIIGVSLGLILGLGICRIIGIYPIIRLPEEIYAIDRLPIAINYPDVSIIALVGLALSFFSSLLPAIRASKMSACEALRYD